MKKFEGKKNKLGNVNVNPMVELLFKGMCFKSWKVFASRYKFQKS